MRLTVEQLIDRGRQGVGIVEVGLVELEVAGIGQSACGPDQFGVQALSEGVGLLGALPVLAVLLAQFLDDLPRERVGFRFVS